MRCKAAPCVRHAAAGAHPPLAATAAFGPVCVQPAQLHHLGPLDLAVLAHIAEHHLLMLDRSEPCLSGSPPCRPRPERLPKACSFARVCRALPPARLGQRLQRALGARRVALDAPGQLVGRHALELTQRGQRNQAVDWQFAAEAGAPRPPPGSGGNPGRRHRFPAGPPLFASVRE